MIFQTIALIAMVSAPSADHKFGLTEAMPRIDGTIRVATYNLLNFYDQNGYNHVPKLDARHGDTSWELSDILDSNGIQIPHTSKERKLELARVIKEIDADILLLQEVESKETLAAFNDNELDALGCRYEFIASEDVGYYRGVEQSILSRFPISDIETWVDADLSININKRTGDGWGEIPANTTNIRFQRSPLHVTVTIKANQEVISTLSLQKDYEIEFFVVHHKAGKDYWHRELEALQIVDYIKRIETKNPNANIFVAGDFNAQSFYPSISKTYSKIGMIDILGDAIATLDSAKFNACWKTHSSNRRIDSFFANKMSNEEVVPNSAFVLGTSAKEYDWKKTQPPSGIASDHFPVVIDIVPIEGEGNSITAPAWPSCLTSTAISASAVSATNKNTDRSFANSVTLDDANFIANTSPRSLKLHKKDCRNLKGTRNRAGFSSCADAIKAGFTPAGCCKPSDE
jgi:endonuclease/exonuclease/phosphatase family metal-dependent hydrolase